MLREGDKTDEQLKHFLERSRICQHQDARSFMTEINRDLLASPELVLNRRAQGGIFISY